MFERRPKNAQKRSRLRFHFKKCSEFQYVTLQVRLRRSRPFHFESERTSVLFREEVEPFLVSGCWLIDARTFVLAFDLITLGRQYPQNWLVQDLLAECVVHVAGREVTDI